ncbi:MAG: hypothetical protein LUC83_03695 [Clostridiales bacterium]|nr:hypothetical protein [Clostridiales bacterium]
MSKKLKFIRRWMERISVVLELILSAVLILVIILALIFLKTPLLEYISNASDSLALLTFITYVINIVIAVELFKMLCSPGADTVLEVMMFVIVRHMIVDETTAWENFLTVLGVAVIIIVKKFILDEKWPKFCSGKKERSPE